MAYGEMPVSSTMRAYYKMEGNANDSTLNGYNLTVTNGSFGVGKFGTGGWNSTSSNSRAYVSNNMGLSVASNMTLSLWFKFASAGGTADESVIASLSMVESKVMYEIRWNKNINRISFDRLVYGGATVQALFNLGASLPTEWSHYLITYNASASGAMNIWLNGMKSPTSNATATGIAPGFPSGFGLSRNFQTAPPGCSINGIYDEVILDARVWSDLEIRNYYAMSKGFLAPEESY